MIRLPERSVTRFFIPLIDVLLLLFCIYLLMPLAQGNEENPGDLSPIEVKEKTQRDRRQLERVRKELQETDRKLAELRREKVNLLHQRLAIKVLEIEPRSGKLYSYAEGGKRVDVESAKDAEQLIQGHKQEVGSRDLYYLFLFPRQDTGYPEQRQFEQYERWFASVPHGLDNPRGGR
jgi:hypothetical protein